MTVLLADEDTLRASSPPSHRDATMTSDSRERTVGGRRAIPLRLSVVAILFILLGVASMSAGASARLLAGPPVLYAIQPRGASELVIQKRPGSTVARFDLSGCPRSELSAVVSPWGLYLADVGSDARRLAVTCEVVGGDRVDLMTAGSRDVARLGNDRRSLSGPLWSHRSGAVAFVSGDFSCSTPKQPTPVELWIASRSGGARRVARITIARDVVRASVQDWSPDGSAVMVKLRAFSGECRYAEHEGDTLYLVTLGTRPSVRQLVRGGDIGHAHWSPDGRLIALTRGGGNECQLSVLDPSTHILRTLTPVVYVPGGCYLDLLTSNWVPGTSQIVFSNGMAVYRAEPRLGVLQMLYSARRNRLRCSASGPDCPGLWIRDVSRSGHVLVSASDYRTLGRTWVIDPSGGATRLPDKPGETPVRFAVA